MIDAFSYDPDFRSRVHPKKPLEPYCCRCQQNVNVETAVPVTINEETWMAVEGHGRDKEIRTNFNTPLTFDLTHNGWLGPDCYKKLRGKTWKPK